MEVLLIRQRKHAVEDDECFEWQLLDSNHLPIGQSAKGALKEAVELAPRRKIIYLVPGEDVLLTSVNVPARSKQQLAKAVPYALEEDLAEDIEALHFALGSKQPDGSYPVAVVSRSRLDTWLEEFKAADIVPNTIIPEPLSLPIDPTAWSLLIEPGRAIGRIGEYFAYTCDEANLEEILNLLYTEIEDKPSLINVYRSDPDESLPFKLPLEIRTQEDYPLAVLASGLEEKKAIDLLQGDYKRGYGAAQLLRPWRFAAALLGVWLTVLITSETLDYWKLAKQQQALEQRIESVFRETFPDVERVVNPRVQMQQRLSSLQGAQKSDDPSGFLPIVEAGGRAIKAITDIQIDTLSYRQGRLEVSLKATNLDALEKVKQRLRQDGFQAEIASADTSGQGVDARLVIQRIKG